VAVKPAPARRRVSSVPRVAGSGEKLYPGMCSPVSSGTLIAVLPAKGSPPPVQLSWHISALAAA
jgi:hypothetical protein